MDNTTQSVGRGALLILLTQLRFGDLILAQVRAMLEPDHGLHGCVESSPQVVYSR